jgi:3'(2'), 5'-bisphosphate nucleotidase
VAHLRIIKDLAVQAGQKIMEVYQLPDFSAVTEAKSDQSPLTLADKAAHEVIVQGLTKHFPGIPVWSEEGRDIPYEERRHWERFWLVDPLDGTKEFLKRNGEFTVNIALIEGTRPVMGVIYVPATGVLYFGERNGGAFVQLPGQEPRPIRVSGDTPERIAVGSRSHSSPKKRRFCSSTALRTTLPLAVRSNFASLPKEKPTFTTGPAPLWNGIRPPGRP